MSLFTNLFSKDKILYRSENEISGKIEVREKEGIRRLFVDGILQSVSSEADNFAKRYWTGMVDLAKEAEIKPKRVLLLGLGAGSVIGVLKQYYDKMLNDAVEIDPEIIKVAKDFFNLPNDGGLSVICADAYDVVSTPSDYELRFTGYDLIIVDTYCGGNFPKKLKSDDFIINLKKLKNSKGAIIFNRFYEPNFVIEIRRFKKKLRRYFKFLDSRVIKAGITTSNILILVRDE